MNFNSFPTKEICQQRKHRCSNGKKGVFGKYPRVDLQLLYGNHEELFDLLRTGGADLVLNDQRRAFSDEYVNLILAADKMYIE